MIALDFTFRAQASLIVLWALGDDDSRRVIERAHERAITTALRWLEDEVAETRWSSGRQRAKVPGLVVAKWRHFDNRDGFPLLHDHCLLLNRGQRPDGSWYALDTVRLYQHVVAAGTLYSLTMSTEVCEKLGLATVPREVTPGLRPVMEIAGVDQDLIDWSSTRRQQMAPVLERITDEYVKEHKRLPGVRGRHALGWRAAQETRRAKKTPKPLKQLRAWWRASAILRFGQERVEGLLERCRAAGRLIREKVGPVVDTALAAVDVAAIVFTCADPSPAAMSWPKRAGIPGLDGYIADAALSRHARQLTVPQEGRRAPAPDRLTYTAAFALPHRWWIAGTGSRPPRQSSRYERARVASLALQNAIRDARTATPARERVPAAPASAAARSADHDHNDDQAAAAPDGVDHPDRDAALTPAQKAAAVHVHQQAAMPDEYLGGRTTDPATWLQTPDNLARLAALTKASEARSRAITDGPQPKQAGDAAATARQQQHPMMPPDQGRGAGRAR